MTMTTTFGNGDFFLWMLEFFLFIIWFWLLIAIFSDIFRDHETSGVVKAMWVVLVVILPYLGILLYLIVRGHGMAARSAAASRRAQDQLDAQIRAAAGTTTTAAEQISQAKSLLDSGAISQAEFDALKTKALASCHPRDFRGISRVVSADDRAGLYPECLSALHSRARRLPIFFHSGRGVHDATYVATRSGVRGYGTCGFESWCCQG